jgi:hypothetical protein
MSISQSFSISTTDSQTSVASQRRLPSIKSVSSTQKCCFICKSTEDRKSIPKTALQQVWKEKNIFLPHHNRCCSSHLKKGRFHQQAMEQIVANKSGVLMSDTEIAQWILELSATPRNAYKKKVRFDFVDEEELSEEEYKSLLGIGKQDFKRLFNYIKGY